MTALLEAKNVSVSYGKIEAVREVSLSINAGQIVTVIGPNGAGKSSLLKALIGVLPYRGNVRYAASDIDALALEDRVEARPLSCAGRTRIVLRAFSRGKPHSRWLCTRARTACAARTGLRDDIYGLFPRLRERHKQLAGTLSGGERQMLALGRALMGQPRYCCSTSPRLVLPRGSSERFSIIIRLGERGASLVVVEQNARAALQIADYGYVIEQGRVALEGPAEQLQSDDNVVASYLGGHNKSHAAEETQ